MALPHPSGNQARSGKTDSELEPPGKRRWKTASERVQEVITKGIDLLEKGQIEEAENCFSEALEICPNSSEAYFRRAQTYQKQQKYGLAQQDYDIVLKMEPQHEEAKLEMSSCLRLCQGKYEVEVCFEEADLPISKKDCEKNPGHTQFISASKFCHADLPVKYRNDNDLFNLLKALIDLTVLLKLTHISNNRPKSFPCYKYRGRKVSTCGSGWVSKVEMFQKENCPCSVCQESGKPQQVWARISVSTAAHVICDSDEGKHTTCCFFYNGDDVSCSDCSSLMKAFEVKSHIEQDRSFVIFFSHDTDLINRLDKTLQEYKGLCESVRKKYHNISESEKRWFKTKDYKRCQRYEQFLKAFIDKLKSDEKSTDSQNMWQDNLKYWQDRMNKNKEELEKSKSDTITVTEDYNKEHSLAVLVSHPHGLGKMVTIGEVEDRTEEKVKYIDTGFEDDMTCYLYTAHSCRGSSGCPVFILGRKWVLKCYHPHSSFSSLQDKQVNTSSVGLDF